MVLLGSQTRWEFSLSDREACFKTNYRTAEEGLF